MRAKCTRELHIRRILHRIRLGTYVVEIVDDAGFLDTWEDRASELAAAMMRQDAMNDAFRLFCIDILLLKHILKLVGTQINVPQQEHVWLLVALRVVLIDLSIIMEENSQNATFHLNRIR